MLKLLSLPPPDPISMAVAVQDYVAPDCRFLTIYRGQVVYVFSKLKGRGRLFWGGSVSLQSVRGKGIGYGVYIYLFSI